MLGVKFSQISHEMVANGGMTRGPGVVSTAMKGERG